MEKHTRTRMDYNITPWKIIWIAILVSVIIAVSLMAIPAAFRPAYAQSETKRILDCPFMRDGAEAVAHMHNVDCFDGDENLVCTLGALEAHTHTEACFSSIETLICGLEENAGHQHSDACYTEHKELVCGENEEEGHRHAESCLELRLSCQETERDPIYSDDGELLDPGHTHSESCWTEVLTCGMEEGEGAHTHSDDCYSTERILDCGINEGDGAHAHNAECWKTEQILTCGQEELPGHVHDDACFRNVAKEQQDPSTVTEADDNETVEDAEAPEKPESDPYADLETSEIWERSFGKLKLSGVWAKDLVAIAQTQLGYTESTSNFDAQLNGGGDDYVLRGWTRYGSWYGYPYGDWCAMFISFCLHYAEIPEEVFPRDCGTTTWVRTLREMEMYAPADEYTPKPGDLIFFDWEGDGLTDHVGLVYEINEEEDVLLTIEGNHSRSVEVFEYLPRDRHIMGYGILPENPEPYPDEKQNINDGLRPTEVSNTESEEMTDADLETAEDENGPYNTQVQTTESPEDGQQAETAHEVPMPEHDFLGSAGGILIRVHAPEGALPENTYLSHAPVNGSMLKDAISNVVNKEILETQALDLHFVNDYNEAVQPMVPVVVTLTPAMSLHADEDITVVNFKSNGESRAILPQTDRTENEKPSAVFETDSPGIFAIVFAS